MKKYAGPPGTFGAIAADQKASFYQHRAHDHHGPGSPAATVVPGQEGLAKNQPLVAYGNGA